jgi:hypothetical protein
MKTPIFVMLMLAMSLFAASASEPSAKKEKPPTLKEEGELEKMSARAFDLYRAGKLEEAAALLQHVLARTPADQRSRALLAVIEDQRKLLGEQHPAKMLEQRLKSLELEKVAFRQAGLPDVIDYLRRESERLQPDLGPVNFVMLVPAPEQLPNVTLDLHKVSMWDVIRYVAAATDVEVTIEPRAVVLRPRRPAPIPENP